MKFELCAESFNYVLVYHTKNLKVALKKLQGKKSVKVDHDFYESQIYSNPRKKFNQK